MRWWLTKDRGRWRSGTLNVFQGQGRGEVFFAWRLCSQLCTCCAVSSTGQAYCQITWGKCPALTSTTSTPASPPSTVHHRLSPLISTIHLSDYTHISQYPSKSLINGFHQSNTVRASWRSIASSTIRSSRWSWRSSNGIPN